MSTTTTPTRNDTAALWLAMLFGAGAAGVTVFQAVTRVIEIAPNRDVPVTASFADTAATMPIGPEGADVEVIAQEAIIRVSGMPGITLWSLILAEVLYALAVLALIVLVCLVIRNIIRGRVFTAQTVGCVGTATLVVGVGWILTWLFTTMGANGAAAVLSASTDPANTAFVIEPVVLFAIASMGVLTAAFQIGHKLQRDAEGLV